MYRKLYEDDLGKKHYRTTPKIFADKRHFIKNSYDESIIDRDYDALKEIEKQIRLLENI